MTARPPVAMTIAGSDSGGGAGIQADLKTFQALGVYGASTLTAITAQNTLGVRAVHEIPTDVIAAQIDAVVEDIGVDAVKVGMLGTVETVLAVAQAIEGLPEGTPVVVDPVMVAESGARLLEPGAERALPEAEVLVGRSLTSVEDIHEAARAIVDLGPRAVVMKGGHRAGDATDVLFDGRTFHTFQAERIDTLNTHGTGCTLSAAIAAGLARGSDIVEAVEDAKHYVTEAIRRSFSLGGGHGPVAHDWLLSRESLRV
ncbi:MAG: bifunctional hydroxymethylpyrimidine kinase/phosphomethylpyrimidine kinase [Chloroflexi bacterium]|nr:MAG: bifunctional hydroxymethylpyrimidine kinase/phosphomethylpyrimidine kinase [Chloroflexota bacterium]